LIDGRYTFLNERLARHYGIAGVRGPEFRRVDLPVAGRRSGVLTQGSVLTVSSYATRTSPVPRGKWILENVLAAPPPDPPAGPPRRVRRLRHGEDAHLRARPRPRAARQTHGAGRRAPGGGPAVSLLGPGGGDRQEPAVPDAQRRSDEAMTPVTRKHLSRRTVL